MFRRKNKGALVYADPRQPRQKKQPNWKGLRNLVIALAVVLGLLAAGFAVGLTLRNTQRRYEDTLAMLARKDYAAARDALEALDNYRDSRELIARLDAQAAAYAAAAELAAQQRYDEAIAAFRALEDYADSAEQAAFRVTYQKALDLLTETEAGQTRLLGGILSADARLTDENGYPAVVGFEAAAALFDSLGDYADAPEMVQRCLLGAARVKLHWQDWEGAASYRQRMDADTAARFDREYAAAQEAAAEETP